MFDQTEVYDVYVLHVLHVPLPHHHGDDDDDNFEHIKNYASHSPVLTVLIGFINVSSLLKKLFFEC